MTRRIKILDVENGHIYYFHNLDQVKAYFENSCEQKGWSPIYIVNNEIRASTHAGHASILLGKILESS